LPDAGFGRAAEVRCVLAGVFQLAEQAFDVIFDSNEIRVPPMSAFGGKADIGGMLGNVRFWPKTDIETVLRNVCFRG